MKLLVKLENNEKHILVKFLQLEMKILNNNDLTSRQTADLLLSIVIIKHIYWLYTCTWNRDYRLYTQRLYTR